MTFVPEYSAQSRFLIIQGPLQLLPHKCATCSRGYATIAGNLVDLEFFNCDLDLEFFGNLYLCVDCVREMAMQLGMVQKKDVLALEKAYEELTDESVKLEEENEELRNDVRNFRALISGGASTSRDPGLRSQEANGTGTSGTPLPAKDSGKSNDKLNARKADAPKQDASGGSSDLLHNLSSDDFSSDI